MTPYGAHFVNIALKFEYSTYASVAFHIPFRLFINFFSRTMVKSIPLMLTVAFLAKIKIQSLHLSTIVYFLKNVFYSHYK